MKYLVDALFKAIGPLSKNPFIVALQAICVIVILGLSAIYMYGKSRRFG